MCRFYLYFNDVVFWEQDGRTALIYAASLGKLDFIPLLVNRSVDIHAEDNDKATALHAAAKEGHADVCLELLVKLKLVSTQAF
jgi:ankyrin repeat protein